MYNVHTKAIQINFYPCFLQDGILIDDTEMRQIGILTRIKDIFYKLKTKVDHYTDICIKPALKA